MFVSTGITLTFESGFLAEIIDVTPPGASRPSIDTSHMTSASNRRLFKPGKLVDEGEAEFMIGFFPGTTPPIDEAASEVVMTFPDSAASVWTFDAFMTDYKPGAPLEDKMTATVTLKVTGLKVIT